MKARGGARRLLGLTALCLAHPVLAAPPSSASADAPQRRAVVADLAYVMGEAHALRQVCVGADDDGWRGRMTRLLDLEAPDPALRRRLINRFNAGFLAQRAQFPTCSDKITSAERSVAKKGLSLSRSLSGPLP